MPVRAAWRACPGLAVVLDATRAWASHDPGHPSTNPWVSAVLWGGLGLVIFFGVYAAIHFLASRASDEEPPR